jgi:ribosomal protein S18 acetylase RimI-like enzyme
MTMTSFAITRSRRVETDEARLRALAVLERTYRDEKGWVLDVGTMFPASDLVRTDVAWFLASRSGQPVGVLRVLFDPAAATYGQYELNTIDPNVDVGAFLANNRIAEIGRFAVIPERRSGMGIALSLMRVATREIVGRGYTQLITDVFENDRHSPLGFHTRVIGFQKVATHETGELRHKGRRITLLLDIRHAYRSLKARGNRFFGAVTRGWTPKMHQSLA